MSDSFDWEKEDKEVSRMLALLEEECLCDPHESGNEDGCPHDEAKTFFAPGGRSDELVKAVEERVEEHVKAHPLIYGGIGESMNAPRRLITMVDLPDRRELDWRARNLLMESDIREAIAKAARKLHDRFLQRDYGNIGFVFDPDAIEYDFQRLAMGMDVGADTQVKGTESLARVLVATVVIRRG